MPAPTPALDRPARVVRGGSLVPAPFTFLGAIAAAVCVASILWMAWGDRRIGAPAWAVTVVSGAVALAGFAGARGCRVVILPDGTLDDQVAWRTVHRFDQQDLVALRVRRGPWRVFEAELRDGTRRVVLGTGPQQFPANLSRQAREHDLRAIDELMGIDDLDPGAVDSDGDCDP
jgi:hypothetical protein